MTNFELLSETKCDIFFGATVIAIKKPLYKSLKFVDRVGMLTGSEC